VVRVVRISMTRFLGRLVSVLERKGARKKMGAGRNPPLDNVKQDNATTITLSRGEQLIDVVDY